MSAVILSLSRDGQADPDPELVSQSVNQEPEALHKPPFYGAFLSFAVLHKTSIVKLILVFLYFVIGCIFYRTNMEWDTLECIYFITVSITTVGYGDYYPDNDAGRMFTCFFVAIGIVVVFGVINEFAQSAIASAEAHALERLDDDRTDDKAPRVRKVIVSILAICSCILAGTIFFYYNEDNCSFIEAFYFSFITTMTVGYGGLATEKGSSRAFSVIFTLFSVILVATAFRNIAAIQAEIRTERDLDALMNKNLDMDMLRAMNINGRGVSEMEFLICMLEQTKGLDRTKDINPLLKQFQQLKAGGQPAVGRATRRTNCGLLYDIIGYISIPRFSSLVPRARSTSKKGGQVNHHKTL